MEILIKNIEIDLSKNIPVKKVFWYDDFYKKMQTFRCHFTTWKHKEEKFCIYNQKKFPLYEFIKKVRKSPMNPYIPMSDEELINIWNKNNFIHTLNRFVMHPVIVKKDTQSIKDPKLDSFISRNDEYINDYYHDLKGVILEINEKDNLSFVQNLISEGFKFEVLYN